MGKVQKKMITLLLIRQIAILFIMIFMGFTLVKTKLMKTEDSRSLSMVALYLIVPCVILEAFQVDYTPQTRDGLLLAFAAAILIHVILLLGGNILGKLFHLDPVEKASVIYSNAGNLIIPIVTGVLGPEYVIYSSAFVSVQLILLWSHCRSMLSGEKKIEVKKILLNINMIAIFIGIILFITGLRLPKIINSAFSSVGSAIAPVCMIVAGMLLANLKMEQLRSFKKLPLIAFLRMIFFPLLMLVLLKFSGMSRLVDQGSTILLISFLATMTPAASTITQMSQIYERNAEYASVINVVTTLLCIITMPVMVFLYQL